ncbi:hypothetical protein F4779DRAFT_308826 [Xylariaceae sp. FL0662B]|nr:hypothetical protein F4779DRAFT_308826 [Xylariaceae sp. FL0662B]
MQRCDALAEIRARDVKPQCKYSYMAKLGKPKGSRNKKTLEQLAPTASRPDRSRSQASDPGPLDQQPPLNDIQFPYFGTHPVFKPNIPPGTSHPGYYIAQGTSSTQPTVTDSGSMASDSQNRQPKLTNTIINANQTVSTAEEDSIGDYEGNWMDLDWQNCLGMDITEMQPQSKPTNSGLTNTPPSAADEPGSPTLVLESEPGGYEQTCTCFKKLTDHLCDLNVTERQQNIICPDVTLYKTNLVLGCAEGVLACHFCRLDSKVLLLVMTVLQTVLNWVRVEYSQHRTNPRNNLPATHFGNWKVPEADGHLIKSLLTSRTLGACEPVINILRLRMEEIAVGASKANLTYQYMDTEPLQHTLQRLITSLGELTEFVKPLEQ